MEGQHSGIGACCRRPHGLLDRLRHRSGWQEGNRHGVQGCRSHCRPTVLNRATNLKLADIMGQTRGTPNGGVVGATTLTMPSWIIMPWSLRQAGCSLLPADTPSKDKNHHDTQPHSNDNATPYKARGAYAQTLPPTISFKNRQSVSRALLPLPLLRYLRAIPEDRR